MANSSWEILLSLLNVRSFSSRRLSSSFFLSISWANLSLRGVPKATSRSKDILSAPGSGKR